MQSRAFFHSLMGNQNNAISRKLLIFPVMLMEQKMLLFDRVSDIRDKLAWPHYYQSCPAFLTKFFFIVTGCCFGAG